MAIILLLWRLAGDYRVEKHAAIAKSDDPYHAFSNVVLVMCVDATKRDRLIGGNGTLFE